MALLLALWLGTVSATAALCPNEAFRSGASAGLPDCRAYEVVSPSDADGRMFFGISGFAFESAFDLFPTELASPDGDSIVFETLNSPLSRPPGPNGSFDIYETQRTPTGWQTVRRISPSGPQSTQPTSGGVSSDHRYAFTHVSLLGLGLVSGSLAGGTGADYLDNPDGSFELTGFGSLGEEPLAQGRYISPGGRHVIFSTGKLVGQSIWCQSAVVGGRPCKVLQLEPNAAPTGTGTVYDRGADGPTHVVSRLPPNVPQSAGQEAFYQGASKDGTSIAFKIEGNLYVRIKSGESGAETEEAAPAAANPVYAGLSQEGKYLFYVEGGEKGTIHRFEVGTEQDKEINPTAAGEVVNVSADGSHVYFIAEEQIGGQGTAGKPNLYDWSDNGPIELVATVAPSDLEQTSISGLVVNNPALTRWTSQAVAPVNTIELGPGADSSRTTPDGKVIVFESRARLTSYDNTEATEEACGDPKAAGEGCTEIYRWEEGGTGVECVSCVGAPEPATGDARLQELESVRSAMVIHNLSDDGSHVFFETPEPLSPADADGVNDVYEWQQEGIANRVGLISSGRSVEYRSEELPFGNNPRPNLLYSITPDGTNVVFLSQDNLTGEAGPNGVPALYDARVNGGFPPAPLPPAPCAEEGCRHATSTAKPSFALPRSKKTTGKGNVRPERRHRCDHRRTGKASISKKKKRCSKKHSKQSRAKASLADIPAQGEAAPSAPAPADGAATTGSPPQPTVVTPVTAAAGEFSEFGINSVAAGLSNTAAAQHPDFTTFIKMNYHLNPKTGKPAADARPEEISVSLPPGLLGNPNALPKCSTGDFLANGDCPFESQVGISKVLVTEIGPGVPVTEPLYNLVPPHPEKEVARFGFYGLNYPVYIDVNVRSASDYGITATVHSAPGLVALLEAETIIWGSPSDESHDAQRMTVKEAGLCGAICGPGREVPRTGKAFLTNPAACQPGNVGLQVTSYQLPGRLFTASAPLPDITGCQGLPFAPSFSATPTTHKAGAPTGLSTKLTLPQHLAASEPATATMREARVTLPQGMQVNPAAANWIEACTEAQVGFHQEVDANCPDGSKLGTAVIKSPALSVPIEGAIYQRTPEPGHQLGLWLVADALGLHIKLPGELQPDKATGRLTAVFSNLPQVPVEEIDLNVWGGDRAPLINPPSCGAFQTNFSFTPHSSDPAASGSASMTIDEGCNAPFAPTLDAGTTKPVAGKFSPLVVDLERADGDQSLRGFELKLPDGLLAKIKGVGRCSGAEAAAGSCPASSRLGTVTASAGAGPDPLWIPQPGRATPGVYLGGPYEGSPLSIITLVPAQAGPFDLGTLVVQSGLGLDPDTNRPVVKADPLPQFFEGVGLDYRRLHVVIDRPRFTLNPTDCSVQKVNSTMTSTQGTLAHPSTRFKVTGCRRLKFKPRLSLKLSGGTTRSAYPALTAVLKARKGDADIARAQVSLPHSEFLAQEHIVTICTRKQFSAKKCPKGSVYGYAEARTPLLAKPLKGPVYLRSSSHPLPDLVAALHGELDVNLVGRIDSHNGGIRTTFQSVPDAPLTKFTLRMKGGAKGLLVNSTDVCAKPHRAQAGFAAQNGRVAELRPVLGFAGCGGKGK